MAAAAESSLQYLAGANGTGAFAQVAEVRRAELRPAEQRVADYLLDLDPTAPGATAGAIAIALGVSQATVVNTVQRLGYAGFGEFRRRLIAERAVAQAQQPVPAAAEDVDPLVAVRHRVFDEARRALDATAALLDDAAFRQAVEVLAAAPQVLCVGNGWSAVLARFAAGTLTKYGVRALAEELAIAQLALIDVADPETVVFAISHRGRQQDLLSVMERAKERGMLVVALTNWATSKLAQQADVVLACAGVPLPEEIHPNQSAGPAAHLTVVRALAEAIAWRKGSSNSHGGEAQANGK
jgi:RpiR family carbohydrate utilization transcriptional regulator